MSKSFVISILKKEQYDSAIEFLRENFFPNEPCAKALDLCPLGYRIPALENQILNILEKNFSLVAREPESKEIIGVIVIDLKIAGEEETHEKGECPCKCFPEKFNKLDHFFSDLCTAYGKRDILKALAVHNALDVFIIATSASHQSQGLGTALFEECCKMAQERGVGAVQCMALSFYTQKICYKLDFQEHFRIPYADYQQAGNPIFGQADMGVHQNGIFFARKFPASSLDAASFDLWGHSRLT